MKNRQDGIVRFNKETGAVYLISSKVPQSTIHFSLQVCLLVKSDNTV